MCCASCSLVQIQGQFRFRFRGGVLQLVPELERFQGQFQFRFPGGSRGKTHRQSHRKKRKHITPIPNSKKRTYRNNHKHTTNIGTYHKNQNIPQANPNIQVQHHTKPKTDQFDTTPHQKTHNKKNNPILPQSGVSFFIRMSCQLASDKRMCLHNRTTSHTNILPTSRSFRTAPLSGRLVLSTLCRK